MTTKVDSVSHIIDDVIEDWDRCGDGHSAGYLVGDDWVLEILDEDGEWQDTERRSIRIRYYASE